MSAEGQVLCGRVALAAIEEAGIEASHVGGLTMGADPIAYAIAHASWLAGSPMDGFSVRKQAKDYGTGQRVEGGVPEGARVVVIEDSMTSGGSALKAVDALEEHGCQVAAILTVVDREEGGRARVEEAGHQLLALFTAADLLEATQGSPSEGSPAG